MPSLRVTSWFALFVASALCFAGCTSDTSTAESGSLNVSLELEGEVSIDQVAWVISGNGMAPMGGTINTSAPGATPSVEVFGLAPGEDYIIEMTATSVDGETSCSGAAEFDVEVGVSTNVMVMLNCKPPEDFGGVRVNGTFNICTDLVRVVVAPLQTSVGNNIELSASGDDYEGDAFEYLWEATGGSIADPSAADTLYTCEEVGNHEVRIVVSDDDFNYCMCDWTVAITCVDGGELCDGVMCGVGETCVDEVCVPIGECVGDADCAEGEVCRNFECVDLCSEVICDDENDCTAEACNPQTGQCDSAPVDDGQACDNDTGMCVEGECVINPECLDDEDCEVGEICSGGECVPDPDFCVNDDDCELGELCVDNECVPDPDFCLNDDDCEVGEICDAGACVPDPDFCFNDDDCEAGEVCTDGACVPDPGICLNDNDCEIGETCIDGACIPDPDFCFNDGDCEVGEICDANACVPDPDFCFNDNDCEAGEVCVDAQCVLTGCVNGVDCADGDLCTADVCDDGICSNPETDCDDQNECTANLCESNTGNCGAANLPDGISCSNGDGTCIDGLCQANSLLGNDFVIVFQANFVSTPELSLFLSGPEAANGVVSISSLGFSEPFSVTPGAVTTVEIPPTAVLNSTDSIERGGAVRVTADEEITVYGLNRLDFTTDAFAALPSEALGQRHRVMAWTGGGNGPSQFAIGAIPGPDDDLSTPTNVTITPSAGTPSRPAGVPYTITLDPLDAYQLQSVGSLTGTLIESDNPIAVYGGNRCANIPNQTTYFCDHVVEQIPSVNTWGTEVLTVPLATRKNGDTFRILTDTDGTTVQLQGAAPESFTLNAGEFAERILVGSYRITADAPILVAQYANGTTYDGVVADPLMMLIPTAGQFLQAYTFATPGSGFPDNYANVVARSEDVSGLFVRLDGGPIPPAAFTILPGTGFSAAQLPISIGTHTLSSRNPVGLFVYGYDSRDSYGYPGGFSIDATAP